LELKLFHRARLRNFALPWDRTCSQGRAGVGNTNREAFHQKHRDLMGNQRNIYRERIRERERDRYIYILD
jgi:hypothetical protein